jgi:hypothetical protein
MPMISLIAAPKANVPIAIALNTAGPFAARAGEGFETSRLSRGVVAPWKALA